MAPLCGFVSISDQDFFLEMMEALDGEFLDYVSKKQKQEQEAAKMRSKARR